MSNSILEIDDLKVSYGAVQALRGVSLGVKEGEIVALLGANGAGKSTLLRAVMNMVPTQNGDVRYYRQSLRRKKTNEIVQSGIALVPEGRGILTTMTVYENLELGAFHRKEWKGDLDKIFGLFPILKERIKQYAGTLSGGEQQMLAIGRALLSKPKLLLLDEPSLGLAPKIIQNIFQLIKRIQSDGISILLIEQNAHMALKVADRCYVLETGQIKMSGSADELASDEDLKKAYLGG
jgi:branched-chain amino acid transport system ATP-binding protein